MLKKIRIDSYQYRVKKGRVDILLERDEENGTFFIPFHYVTENEKLDGRASWSWVVEDDGDLVLLYSSINDCHLNRKNKSWIPLRELTTLPLSKGDSFVVIQHCLALFLDNSPSVESALLNKVKGQLDNLLTAKAKKDYVDELKRVFDGGQIIYCDAFVTPPDKGLLQKEMETLAHFKLYKMNRLDVGYRHMRYSYGAIDWETFGAKIEPIELNMLSDDETLL